MVDFCLGGICGGSYYVSLARPSQQRAMDQRPFTYLYIGLWTFGCRTDYVARVRASRKIPVSPLTTSRLTAALCRSSTALIDDCVEQSACGIGAGGVEQSACGIGAGGV
jgi:hypothetical protein